MIILLAYPVYDIFLIFTLTLKITSSKSVISGQKFLVCIGEPNKFFEQALVWRRVSRLFAKS